MPKPKDDGPDAVSELKWFLLVLVALFVVWVYTGGPQKMMQKGNTTSTQINKQTQQTAPTLQAVSGIHFVKDYSGISSAPQNQYLILSADSSNTGTINLTGMTLRSNLTKKFSIIGQGSNLPVLGGVSYQDNINVSAGDKVVIISGVSPIGVSYKLNKCINQVGSEATYNNCVSLHKNDSDFYKNEWRIYLGQSNPIWQNSTEDIKLLDQNGLVVDSFTY